MTELSFNPNAPSFGTGRVTPGEALYWRNEPDRSAPVSDLFIEGGTEIEILDVAGDFVLARSRGVAGWLLRDRISLPTIVRLYKGQNQQDAVREFQIDAAKWAQRGYYPTSQSWAQGSYGCGAFLLVLLLCIILIGVLIFIYMLIVKPQGTLTVTYESRASQTPVQQTDDDAAATEPARDTKRCPQCAEDVLAEARICRFCRYDFESANPASQ